MQGKRFWTIAIAVIMFMNRRDRATRRRRNRRQPTTPTATTELPLTAIPDGTWLVGEEVPAGIYSAAGGAQCSWKRLSGFGGTFDDTIAGDFGVVRPIVEITPTDNGFSTSGCGLWTLVKPPSTPTPTPAAALTPTSTPTPTLVASATPRPVVKIPLGWKRIEDDRLGYSLAVPFHMADLRPAEQSARPSRQPARRRGGDGAPARISGQPRRYKSRHTRS